MKLFSSLAVVGGLFVALAACGAESVTIGGVADAGSQGLSADGGPWSAVCPEDIPAEGAACSIVTLRCEYGSSTQPACNTIAYCTEAPLHFMVTSPRSTCPLTLAPNAAACPATYASVAAGNDCTSTGLARGTPCDYPEGTCTCGDVGSNISPLPPPAWICTSQPATCPSDPPRFGSPCTAEGLRCNYHPCDAAGASAFCENGVWNGGEGGCVTSGGG